MAYNDSPLPNQRVKDTQAPIRENFQVIQTAFSVDHVGIQVSADQGKHNKVTMPVQGAAPGFLAGETGLYNKLPAAPYPLTGRNEIFVHPSSGIDIPMTARGVNTAANAHGYTYLPSGILMKWGRIDNITVGNNVPVLPLVDGGGLPIPDFTTFLSGQITTLAVAITGSVRFISYTVATRVLALNANTSGASVSIFYFLIGT